MPRSSTRLWRPRPLAWPDSRPRPSTLYELAWIALGIATAVAAMRLLGGSRRVTEPTAATQPQRTSEPAPTVDNSAHTSADASVAEEVPPREEATDAAEPAVPTLAVETTIAPDSREMALSMASELASLVSAIEGRAHHLIEASPDPQQLPEAAEATLISIARLRGLHSKLIAFGGARPTATGTTNVTELIANLSDDLQEMQLGLELRFDPPADPPIVDACPATARDAILFVCGALLKAERGATRLTFSVERSFATDDPKIIVELNLEWINSADSRKREEMVPGEFALDLEAARQLVSSHGGELAISHLPGKSVQAVVQLPMAVPPELLAAKSEELPSVKAATASNDPTPHNFGGALVLESDPTLRAVLSRELKASGRAVFACADGASAHTFLQATPDRFELLIVDDPHQLDEHTPLARTIREQTPDLKICLIAPNPAKPPTTWPTLHCLEKPFGVHELRRKLASILTVG